MLDDLKRFNWKLYSTPVFKQGQNIIEPSIRFISIPNQNEQSLELKNETRRIIHKTEISKKKRFGAYLRRMLA